MPTETFKVKLESGTIQLKIHQQQKWRVNDLLNVAQRCNPKRAFLFVSKVLGRHIPQSPKIIRQAFTDLAEQIPTHLPQPILIVGMAETAVGLAAGIHHTYTNKTTQPCLFTTTTRHPLDVELLCEFEEEHSHATKHFIHIPPDPKLKQQLYQTKTLVMVDDEATTGKTFLNLVNALKHAGLKHIEQIVTVTLTDWSNGEITAKLGHRTKNISLLYGQWDWFPHNEAPTLYLPQLTPEKKTRQPLNQYKDYWGRIALPVSIPLCLHAKPTKKGERILVLGSGEYVWQPFLLAENLENQGANVKFSATTRSPIAIGHAIKQAMSFNDNYGVNIPMFVYNIEPTAYDRVILCSETGLSSWDQAFIRQFPQLEFIG